MCKKRVNSSPTTNIPAQQPSANSCSNRSSYSSSFDHICCCISNHKLMTIFMCLRDRYGGISLRSGLRNIGTVLNLPAQLPQALRILTAVSIVTFEDNKAQTYVQEMAARWLSHHHCIIILQNKTTNWTKKLLPT